MGLGTVALVAFAVYLATVTPPRGHAPDILFSPGRSLNIGLVEWIRRRLSPMRLASKTAEPSL